MTSNGKEGIYARLFSETSEQMLEAELTDELGYEPYQAKGRNSGNSQNGHYASSMRPIDYLLINKPHGIEDWCKALL